MEAGTMPGAEALQQKGWWGAHRFLVLRRFSQLSVLLLFLLGPWFGVWLVKGNISSSLVLDTVPLTDPMLFLQTLLAGTIPTQTALLGALIVLIFYWLVGGRVYCSWVCPINAVTDSAGWLRRKLKLRPGTRFSRDTRDWLLAGVMVIALLSGTLAYELINPVSLVYRGLVFGLGVGWGVLLAIFLLDLLVAPDAWCGHLCPVGAFYSLVGSVSLVRVVAVNRENCDDCLDCYAVCPESQVIRPALKGRDKGLTPVIESGKCNNCGRCIDVCARDVFQVRTRFYSLPSNPVGNKHNEVLS
ncbi:MAG: quinol dehydrogenase ferredoxin subunit NapH [bacterium]